MGGQPELPGDHPWCTVLAGLYNHIYRGREDAAPLPTTHAQPPGTARRGLRHCIEEAGSAPCKAAERGASWPRRRSEAALNAAPDTGHHGDRDGCSRGSSPVHLQGATVEQPYPPVLLGVPLWSNLIPDANTMPKLLWLLMSRPMPGPATPVGEWLGPPSMMKMHGMITSNPTHAVLPHSLERGQWHGEPVNGRWKPPGEALAGNLVTRWILVRRRPHLKP